MMGQLLPKCITPDVVFEHVGLDFAGPLYLKRGSVCKPTILKSCFCIDVSKGSSLGTCFRSLHWIFHCLPQKICRPKRKAFLSMEWSWHKFCGCQSSSQGALCLHSLYKNGSHPWLLLNSRYHVAFHSRVSPPIWRPMGLSLVVLCKAYLIIPTLLNRSVFSEDGICAKVLWDISGKDGKNKYIVALRRYSKRKRPNENFQVGDVVIKEDNLVSSHWRIARGIESNPGADGMAVTKVALLLPCEK